MHPDARSDALLFETGVEFCTEPQLHEQPFLARDALLCWRIGRWASGFCVRAAQAAALSAPMTRCVQNGLGLFSVIRLVHSLYLRSRSARRRYLAADFWSPLAFAVSARAWNSSALRSQSRIP